MIQAEQLTKNYGNVAAVRGVSFSVSQRQVVGLLGPNGAGKSTLLRIVAGFLGATAGRVLVGGFDVALAPLKARRCLGYMPESTPLYPELRVSEYLRFRAELKGVARAERRSAVQRALELTQTASVAEKLIAHLSKGYRQRVGLADAIISDPPLLILDEPTAGLDPNQIRQVRDLILTLGQTRTVLLSTHILSEVEATCQRAIVIDQGVIAAEGSLPELAALGSSRSAEFRVLGPQPQLLATLDELSALALGTTPAQLTALSENAHLVTLECATAGGVEALIERAIAAFVRANLAVQYAAPKKASLEEVFARVTGRPSGTARTAPADQARAQGARPKDASAP